MNMDANEVVARLLDQIALQAKEIVMLKIQLDLIEHQSQQGEETNGSDTV